MKKLTFRVPPIAVKRLKYLPGQYQRRAPYVLRSYTGGRDSPPVRLYWWNGQSNFGDLLSPWILRRLGVSPVHARAGQAEVVAIGSLVDSLPRDFAGVLWGTGVRLDRDLQLPRAQIVALRGHMSKDRLGITHDLPLGDPALLLSRLVPKDTPRRGVGLVPHYAHKGNPAIREFIRRNRGRLRVVNVARRPADVVSEIASCEYVLSTSLHGLVVADALGIPAARLSVIDSPLAGDFKYRDYESVLGGFSHSWVPVAPGAPLNEFTEQCASPSRETVESVCSDLMVGWNDALDGLGYGEALARKRRRAP